MGLINLEPTLREGEEVQWRRPAAHSIANRTVPGTLYATSLGLVFMPNRLNRRRHMIARRIARDDQPMISVEPRNRSLKGSRAGGARTRLRVETRHGDVYLFVINHPDRAAQELLDLIAGGPGQA